jgi:hypothetical protein
MITKRHDCKLTERMVRKIEYVLPKLKYSVYLQQVKLWLENFEENEVDSALDFLFYLEYIPLSELQLRLNHQLALLDKHFGKTIKYLLVPYAEYPKSNDIVAYLISKCPAFSKLKKEKRINISTDIQNYKFNDNTVIVFVDDFIGSGKSFQKWYRKNKLASFFGSNQKIHDEQAILSAIIMEDASLYMKHCYPDILVFADFRSKIFCKTSSPFNLSDNCSSMRNLCLKYGREIVTDFQPPNKTIYSPLGFHKSEALIAFDYGTPNNSLSIIWGDSKWKPIFPRSSKSRMKKASEIKSEAAFYLGLMNKLEINFNDDIDFTIDDEIIKLSARDDHAILVYLILTDKLYLHLQVCQVLGITLFELDKIILKASQKKLVTREGKLTRRGIIFLTQIKKASNIFTFREKDKLEVKNNTIFVPKSFRNLT